MNFNTTDRYIRELTAIKNYDNVVAAAQKISEHNERLKREIEELKQLKYKNILEQIENIFEEMSKPDPSFPKEVIESGILERIEQRIAEHHVKRSELVLFAKEAIGILFENLGAQKDKEEREYNYTQKVVRQKLPPPPQEDGDMTTSRETSQDGNGANKESL